MTWSLAASIMLLSIIIPLAPNETCWKVLLRQLNQQASELSHCEIILAYSDKPPVVDFCEDLNITCLKTPTGRAQCMNTAANEARGEYLWFLHADTELSLSALSSLLNHLTTQPITLMYFDIAFNQMKRRMLFNSFGVYLRSRLLLCPFGDQAFCIRKDLFLKAGQYREDVTYGEDHLFVWQARSMGIKIHALNTAIKTSARKYKRNGWIKTTLSHWAYFLRQAVPAFYLYLFKSH